MTVLMPTSRGSICTSGFPEQNALLMFALRTNGYSRLLLARLAGVWRAAASGGDMIVVIMQSAQQGIPAALSLRTGG